MKLSYTQDYQIKIWKNNKIIDLLLFKTRGEVDEWRKQNPDIKLKYDTTDNLHYTLEQ